jgi:hypothetical protein
MNHVSLTGPEGYRHEGRRKKEEGFTINFLDI